MHQTFFSIENWDGWAPGLTKKQDWKLWANLFLTSIQKLNFHK